jgi:flagellar basal body-associated protein FliL
MKVVIVILLVAVLAALAGAGLFMLRKGSEPGYKSPAMARALAVRVALSITVFLFVLLAWYMGWIKPSGIPISA